MVNDSTSYARTVARATLHRLISDFPGLASVTQVDHATLSTLRILPRNPQALTLLIVIYFDGSYQLFAGRILETPQSDPIADEAEAAEEISFAIGRIAELGLVTVRKRKWLGAMSPAVTGLPYDDSVLLAARAKGSKTYMRSAPWN